MNHALLVYSGFLRTYWKLRPILSNLLFVLLILVICNPSIAAGTAQFTLQLASFSTAEEAEARATELRTNGVQIEILMTLLDDHKISYRLRAGNFPSALKARTQGEIWRAYGWIKTYWVTRAERHQTKSLTFKAKSAAAPKGVKPAPKITLKLADKKLPELGLGELLSAVEGKWGLHVPESLSVVAAKIVFPKAGIVRPAVILLDETKVRQMLSPLQKKRELLHPLDMRFEPGVKISPGYLGLNFTQAEKLTASLRSISGFRDLNFDDRGFLVLGNKITGGSQLARALLQAALASNEIVEIEGFNKSAIIVFGALLTAEFDNAEKGRVRFNRIQIDFNDFAALKGDARAIQAFEFGFVFLHELTHGVWKLSDDSKFAGVGECEAYINQIRRELGLPERLRYHFKINRVGSGVEQGELWFVTQPENRSNRKEYLKIFWDNSTVGDGGFVTPVATGKVK